MDQTLFVKNEIIIKRSIEKVWDYLTKPELTKLYMFGCETVSDWKVGSELLWKAQWEGKEMVFVKGHIVECNAPHKLIYTTFDPNSKLEDIPENYVNVIYELSTNSEGTLFKVSQGDFSKVGDGERRYQEVYNNGEGWNPVLVEIKRLAEQ
jgi:uncharacterized protein YndB with AHSA1/START domain